MLRGSRAPIVAGVAAAWRSRCCMVFFLVLPKMDEVSTANEELAAAQAQQGTLESQLAALEQAEAAAPEAKAIIQDVERQIPPTADEPGLLLLVKNAAVRSGQWRTDEPDARHPGPRSRRRGCRRSRSPCPREGGYFQLTEFLYSIETLPRAAKVTNVQLAPAVAEVPTDHDDGRPNLLQLQASVCCTRATRAPARAPMPGPTEDAAAAGGA